MDGVLRLVGTTQDYANGATIPSNSTPVSISTESSTKTFLYAVFKRTITFNSGVSCATTSNKTQYYNPRTNTNVSAVKAPLPSTTGLTTYSWSPLGYRANTTAGAAAYAVTTNNQEIKPEYNVGTSSTTLNLYAVYSRTLTIVYDGNGETGGSTSNQTVTQYYNTNGSKSTASFTTRANGFTKTGYSFSKWARGSVSGTQVEAGATTTFSPAYDSTSTTLKLYAIWIAHTYTVEYYQGNNSTTAGATKKGTSSHTYGTPSPLKTYAALGATAPSGWTFAGWSSHNGTTDTTVHYSDGQNVSQMTSIDGGIIKLYAIFSRTIRFNSGSNCTTKSTATQRYNPYKTTGSITSVSAPAPSVTGLSGFSWEALGYRANTTATTATYTVTTSATNITPAYNVGNTNTTVNLYAVYNKTITFYSGVNKATTNPVTQYLNTSGNTVSAITAPAPTAITNWTALGYRGDTDADSQDYTITTSQSWSPAYNVPNKLYAVYKRVLTITYNGNGNTGGSTTSTTKDIYMNTNSTTTSDQTVKLANNGFTRTGYTFNNWNTNSSGTGTPYNERDDYNPGLAYNVTTFGKTIYATWTRNEVTITLLIDGQAYDDSGMKVTLYSGTTATTYTATISSGNTATLQSVPSGTYNVYAGKDSNHKTALVDSGVDVTVTNAGSATINYYVLTVTTVSTSVKVNGTTVANNGTVDVLGGTGTASSNYGHAIVATPSTGYTFSSWSKTSGTVTFGSTTTASTTAKVAATSTIKATSTANTYTIAYNLDEGTAGANAPTSVTYNTAIQISNPTKSGYTFTGWTSSTTDGLNTSTAKRGTTSNPTTAWDGTATTNTYFKNLTPTAGATVTLTATWTRNDVTITLLIGGTAYDSSGMKVTLYNGTTATTHTATIATGNTATLQGVPSGTYNVYAGKDSNHKTALGDSGVDVTVTDAGSVTINYYVLTVTTANTSVKVNGTTVANNGTVDVLGGTGTASSNFGHTIVATPSTGYTFSSWSKTSGTVTFGSTTTASTTAKVAAASTIKATSTANTYTIAYNLDEGTAGANAPTSGTYNTAIQISNPTKSGYTFTGWTSSTTDGLNTSTAKRGTTSNPTTTWDGTATTNTYFKNLTPTLGATVTLTATWTSNDVTITINNGTSAWSGSGINVALYQNGAVAYAYNTAIASGSTVTFTAIPNGTYQIYASKAKSKLTELGNTNETITISNNSATKTITYYDLTKTQGANTTLTIRLDSSSGTAISSTQVLNGMTIYAKVSPASGYSASITKNGTAFTSGNTFAMSETTTIVSSAQIINYTISYNLDGGTVGINNPTTYNVTTSTFTLNNPSKSGYEFAGWTGSNGSTPQTTVTITQGTTGNKSYTANWIENVVVITVKKDDAEWPDSGMNVALYQNGVQKYTTTVTSGTQATFHEVIPGTYNVYAGNNATSKTLVDTGQTVIVGQSPQ